VAGAAVAMAESELESLRRQLAEKEKLLEVENVSDMCLKPSAKNAPGGKVIAALPPRMEARLRRWCGARMC
jgi:hypothetical protein